MNNIRSVMKAKSVTKKDLSEKIGKSAEHLSSILSGKVQASPREQYLIANALGVNIIDIFTPEERDWYCPLCGSELGVVSSMWRYCPECAVQVHRKSKAVYDIDDNGNLRKREP